MTYAQYGLVEATDYNNFVGTTTGSTPNRLNTVYATGSVNAGYGQTPVSQVPTGTLITVAQWSSLINNISNVALHQGTSISSVTPPTTTDTISFISSMSTNISSIYSSRLNAATQGTTSSLTTTSAATWTDNAVFTQTVTFGSGDRARYFFNSGGQIALTFSHPNGAGINSLFNQLATACGTIVISAPSSGTASIVGTSYNGITKVGGSGSPSVLNTNLGYYGLTTTQTEAFRQLGSTGPTSYQNSYIKVEIKSNGPQGSNGDTGSLLTIVTTFEEVPNGLTVSTGSAVTCTLRYPESTYISDTWGAVSLYGSVVTT